MRELFHVIDGVHCGDLGYVIAYEHGWFVLEDYVYSGNWIRVHESEVEQLSLYGKLNDSCST